MHTDTTAGLIILLVFLAIIAGVYFLPTIVAFARKHPNSVAIAALNFFLGWTIAGWVISLVWALKDPTPQQVVVVQQPIVVQHQPPLPPPR
jgi:hypothetical protein